MTQAERRGKIKNPPNDTVVKYLIAPHIASDLAFCYQDYVACNKAHVLMLAKQGIINEVDAKKLLRVSKEMEAMGDKPTFEIDPSREDLFFNIEHYLIDKVGIEVGGQLQTARSRNDLYAATTRLSTRRAYFEICDVLNRFRSTVIRFARENLDAVMAGYTCLQPSEPITLAHYCSAVLSGLERDYRFIANVFDSINLNPLGGCSMASTTWPIDRSVTTEALGFDAPLDNSLDCNASRDYAVALLAGLSMFAVTLSRFAHDMYLWSTPEYHYIEVDDSCAVCSSIMPQKKNPWTFEHVKAKASHVEGFYVGALNCLKNIPYGHVEDVCGEATNYVFQAIAEMRAAVELMEVTVAGVTVNKAHMLEAAQTDFCTVTELANAIVRKDKVSFRAAHEVVAGVVDYMLTNGKFPRDIVAGDIDRVFEELFGKKTTLTDAEIYAALDPAKIMLAKGGIGGTSPTEVTRQLDARATVLAADEKEVSERRARVAQKIAKWDAVIDKELAS